MPRLVFQNISKEDVKFFSINLAEEIASVIACPTDWLTFEHIENTLFIDGTNMTRENVYLDVFWFARESETQDKVAETIHRSLHGYYKGKREITIIFHELKRENYYENGKHY